jgi:hypothetical protein
MFSVFLPLKSKGAFTMKKLFPMTLMVMIILTLAITGCGGGNSGGGNPGGGNPGGDNPTSSWKLVGSAGFSASNAYNTSIVIDSNNVPYVAYIDFASYCVTVMKYTGTGASGWESVIDGSWNPLGMTVVSLAVGSDNTLYVAYIDNNMKATVMKKYAGTGTWGLVGTGDFSSGDTVDDTIGDIRIAIDRSVVPNVPYVFFRDLSSAISKKATVMKYTGSGTHNGWDLVGTAGFSTGKASDISFAVDSHGVPYAAYVDGSSSKATVMKYTGNGTSGWENVGSDGFSAGSAFDTSIAFDSNNVPYVAYADASNSYKTRVMKFNGTSWETVGSAGFSAGEAECTSIAMNGSGVPYLIYKDGGNSNKATVMKLNGAIWETVGSTGFSAGEVDSTSLAIDSSGVPYVVYRDYANSEKATVMKFAP